MTAKVLIYDIETAPNLGYIWAKWQQNVLKFEREWFMLSFAYKWLGEKTTHVVALPDFDGYDEDRFNDYNVVAALWDLFDEADITITHNGKNFDKGKAYARMIYHGMMPPNPTKEIDTCQVARRQFAFSGNSLKDLARFLGIANKGESGGLDTWFDCMDGDEAAWARMKKYNKQDVVVTEQLYLKLRPWIKSHPNMSLYEKNIRPEQCPRCLVAGCLQGRGWQYSNVTKKHKYQCMNCGGYCLSRAVSKTQTEYLAA